METFGNGTPYLWSVNTSDKKVAFSLITRSTPIQEFYEGAHGTDEDIHSLFTTFASAGLKRVKEEHEDEQKEDILASLDRRIEARSTEFQTMFLPFNEDQPDLPQGYLLLRPVGNQSKTPAVENTTLPGTWCEWSRKRIRLETTQSHETVVSAQQVTPKTLEYELVAGSTFTVTRLYSEFQECLRATVNVEICKTRLVPRFDEDNIDDLITSSSNFVKKMATILDNTEKANWDNLDPLEPLYTLNESSKGGVLFFFNFSEKSQLAKSCVSQLMSSARTDISYADYQYEYIQTVNPELRLHVNTEWLRCDQPEHVSSNRPFSTIWFKKEFEDVILSQDRSRTDHRTLQAHVVETIDLERASSKPIDEKINAVITEINQYLNEDISKNEDVKEAIRQHFDPTQTYKSFKNVAVVFDYVYKIRDKFNNIFPITLETYESHVLQITGHCETLPIINKKKNLPGDEPIVPTGQFQMGMLESNIEPTTDDADDVMNFDERAAPYEIDLHYKNLMGYATEIKKVIKQTFKTLLACTKKTQPQVIGYYQIGSGSTKKKGKNFLFFPPCAILKKFNLNIPILKHPKTMYPDIGNKNISSASLTVLRYVVEETLNPSVKFKSSKLFSQIERIVTAKSAFPLCASTTEFTKEAYETASNIIEKHLENALVLIQHTSPSGEQARLGLYSQGFEPPVVQVHRAHVTDKNKLSYFVGVEATAIIESIQIATKFLVTVCKKPENSPTNLDNSSSVQSPVPLPVGTTDQILKSKVPIVSDGQPLTNVFYAPGQTESTLDMDPYYSFLGVSNFVNKAGHVVLGKTLKTGDLIENVGTAPGSYSVTLKHLETIECTKIKPSEQNTYSSYLVEVLDDYQNIKKHSWISIPLFGSTTQIIGYISFTVRKATSDEATKIKFTYYNEKVYLQIIDHKAFEIRNKHIVCENVRITTAFDDSVDKQTLEFSFNSKEAKTNFFAYNSGSVLPSVHKQFGSDSFDPASLGKEIGNACQGIFYSNKKDYPRATFCVLMNEKAKELLQWLNKSEHGEPRSVNLEAKQYATLTDEREAYMLQMIRDGERHREALAGTQIRFGSRDQSSMVVPAVVLLQGPHKDSLATAARVDGYVIKSSIYRLHENETIRRMRDRLSVFRTLPALATKHCIAARFHRYQAPVTLKKLLSEGSNAIAASLAKLMLLLSELNAVQNRPNQGVNRSSLEILGSNIDATIDDCLFG